jgi:hypothetical protein
MIFYIILGLINLVAGITQYASSPTFSIIVGVIFFSVAAFVFGLYIGNPHLENEND